MRFIFSSLLVFPFLAFAQSDYPACSPNSKKPTWSLKNISYHAQEYWTTPAHAVPNAQISFSIQQCPTFYRSIAFFKFTNVGGKLELNQTYTCWEDLGPTLVTYFAYGFNNTIFDCNTNITTKPDWTPESGGYYKTVLTDCAPTSLEVVASEISAIA
ncbi:hypothetical protein K469DRAFT_691534 [Zopfia rhizophila CBS 207.26]|uniref:AA1-like domain-containing protein n=1 Tax=Zopfia rhizophila CBS 207.26 TaxID=1314779 RepID=A0A6A6DUR2_9PEZI|nr:hypothetical protein K469DRAFT_691534 [Zopfia rhizophila CBS 207.26]